MTKSTKKAAEKTAEINEENQEQAPENLEEQAKAAAAAYEKKPEEDAAQLKDQLLRTMAESENIRKRAARDVEEANKYGATSLARDLVSVLENLHRAEENIPKGALEADESFKNFYEGITLTKNELLSVFEKHGITRIEPMGQPFDHNFHQAVVQIEDAKNPPGTIVQVMQAGYVLKDRLLRPAMVGVAKAPAEN